MSTRPHDLAFPLIDTTGTGGPYLNLGLTKREYFAGLAMQGMLASWPKDARLKPDTTAERATLFADALIAALNKEPQS